MSALPAVVVWSVPCGSSVPAAPGSMFTSAPSSRVGSFPDAEHRRCAQFGLSGLQRASLLALVGWLTEEAVTYVAMESTGSYWKPVHNILEAHL